MKMLTPIFGRMVECDKSHGASQPPSGPLWPPLAPLWAHNCDIALTWHDQLSYVSCPHISPIHVPTLYNIQYIL